MPHLPFHCSRHSCASPLRLAFAISLTINSLLNVITFWVVTQNSSSQVFVGPHEMRTKSMMMKHRMLNYTRIYRCVATTYSVWPGLAHEKKLCVRTFFSPHNVSRVCILHRYRNIFLYGRAIGEWKSFGFSQHSTIGLVKKSSWRLFTVICMPIERSTPTSMQFRHRPLAADCTRNSIRITELHNVQPPFVLLSLFAHW